MIKTTCLLICAFISLFASRVHEMTLEEKVGQLLMVHFNGEVANEDARFLIQETQVGGIIYYNWSNGLTSPEQVCNLSLGLQELAQENRLSIPLVIAVDQEGGKVTRLREGFTELLGNSSLGETGDPGLARESALIAGKELRAVGITLNLAPVVDVNVNPQNPVIGARSFSHDPQVVADFGKAALEGYRESGISACLKHFPGHGDVTVDSHQDLPIVSKSMKELEEVELFPFAKLSSTADAIMTAHLLVPVFDEENCSTLSAKTLSYLRDTLLFEGVIITDSLVMEGVLKKCKTVDEAAIQALNAGCDLLLLGGKQLVGEDRCLELTPKDIQRIHRSLMDAVKSGRIQEGRVDEAVEKILKLKYQYGPHESLGLKHSG